MKPYSERAKKFIEEFYDYLMEYNPYHDFVDEMCKIVRRFNADKTRRVIFRHGATRICFITSDYVIKLDRFDKDSWAARFGGCEEEMEFYEYAKQEGYDEFFAKIEQYQYKNITFYIMPRIRNIGRGLWYKGMDNQTYYWIETNIYDIHEGNYGRINGHGVFIDYAANYLHPYEE